MHDTAPNQRVWFIDPIDGTDNYIANDGQYSVMIGLVVDSTPVFGWVYAPTTSTAYFGGPKYGSWRKRGMEEASRFYPSLPLKPEEQVRLMLGWRDRKNHPWINNLPQVTLVKTGSIGLKVTKILDNEADLFVYLSGKLKIWDTAGPVAIALGGGLEVGTMESEGFHFPDEGFVHKTSVIIGRSGSIEWCRAHLGNSVSKQ
jgi:3'(2'), 5'-bisphosphate nucleotidase